MSAYSEVKIFFRLETDSDGYPPVDSESMWAVPVEAGYRLDNIPFFVRGVSSEDIVEAAEDENGVLWCTGLVSRGGHSTFRLLLSDADQVTAWRDKLKALGCETEQDAISTLIAVDIPPEVSFDAIWTVIGASEQAGDLDVEEGCMQHAL